MAVVLDLLNKDVRPRHPEKAHRPDTEVRPARWDVYASHLVFYGALDLLMLGTMTWFIFIRPAHRKRYRRAIAELPRWTLRPE